MDAEVLLRSGSKTQVNLSGGTIDRPGLPLSGVTYKGKQERRVPFGSLEIERRPNELIIEVIVPRPDRSCGTSFMRIGRTPTDIALLNAAAFVQVTGGVYSRVRLALGGVNMGAVRLQAVEGQLEGQPAPNAAAWTQFITPILQAGMVDFHPPSDFRASDGYRRASGTSLAYRVLEEATNVSHWHGMVSTEEGM